MSECFGTLERNKKVVGPSRAECIQALCNRLATPKTACSAARKERVGSTNSGHRNDRFSKRPFTAPPHKKDDSKQNVRSSTRRKTSASCNSCPTDDDSCVFRRRKNFNALHFSGSARLKRAQLLWEIGLLRDQCFFDIRDVIKQDHALIAVSNTSDFERIHLETDELSGEIVVCN